MGISMFKNDGASSTAQNHGKEKAHEDNLLDTTLEKAAGLPLEGCHALFYTLKHTSFETLIYDIRAASKPLEIDFFPAAASLFSSGLKIADYVVSHTTDEHAVSSILEGVRLESHPRSVYGGDAFYVAKSGFSMYEKHGNRMVVFSLPRETNILDASSGFNCYWRERPRFALENGYDAIKYAGNFTDLESYNLAILRNPEQLKPIGVFPIPKTRVDAISLPTIRFWQAMGVVGTVLAAGHAANEIIESDEPLLEAVHQTSLFAAAAYGGAVAGSIAIC